MTQERETPRKIVVAETLSITYIMCKALNEVSIARQSHEIVVLLPILLFLSWITALNMGGLITHYEEKFASMREHIKKKNAEQKIHPTLDDQYSLYLEFVEPFLDELRELLQLVKLFEKTPKSEVIYLTSLHSAITDAIQELKNQHSIFVEKRKSLGMTSFNTQEFLRSFELRLERLVSDYETGRHGVILSWTIEETERVFYEVRTAMQVQKNKSYRKYQYLKGDNEQGQDQEIILEEVSAQYSVI